ncbi:MAG: UbiX family flavin prenyltransferase [Methanothrix sp.]|uniref:UbiX family flavin prenyltransferase n=1 Tax=Methanothrix sp. TaxID=90426 RepID=UPI003D2881A4
MEIVLGISGASGVVYGTRLLEVLRERCFVNLIITEAARKILEIECGRSHKEMISLADRVFEPDDLTSPIASGSYLFDAMVVAPCSMRTMAAIACGISDTLIARVADVCLKQRRTLVLVPRETPLSLIHLRNMVAVSEAGGIILPASPSFYSRPRSVAELVDTVVCRILDILGIDNSISPRWRGFGGNAYNDTGEER